MKKRFIGRQHHGDLAVRRAEDPFEALQRGIDRLFEEFRNGGDFDLAPVSLSDTHALDIQMPRVDVVESDDEVQVSADLPGIDEKNVEVTLGSRTLTIRGEKSAESDAKKKDYRIKERVYGSFHRVISLPEGVDTDKAKATFKKGVLTVAIPKTQEAKAARRKIAVNAA